MKKGYYYLSGIMIIIIVSIYLRYRDIKQKAAYYALFAFRYIGNSELTKGDTEVGFKSAKFETLMRKYGFQKGYDWCAIFVKAMYVEASKKNKKNTLNKLLNMGTQKMYKNLKDAEKSGKYYWLKAFKSPKVGRLVTWQKYNNGTPTGKGHSGIVYSINKKNGTFKSIEGNVPLGNGYDGVKIKIHDIKKEQARTNGLKLKPLFFEFR